MPLVIKKGFHPVVPTKGRVRVGAMPGARLAFDATKQEAKRKVKIGRSVVKKVKRAMKKK